MLPLLSFEGFERVRVRRVNGLLTVWVDSVKNLDGIWRMCRMPETTIAGRVELL